MQGEAVAAPPGVTLPPGDPMALIGDLLSQLNLQEFAVLSPWGGRTSDTNWYGMPTRPTTNISVAPLSDDLLRMVPQITFGTPLSFLAILTPLVRCTSAGCAVDTMNTVAGVFRGSPYEFFETAAVYDQADAGEPPKIKLLHWGRIRGAGDPDGGTASMQSVAQSLGGQLVFATQVNYDLSTSRSWPSTPFLTALNSQLGGGAMPIEPGPGVQPTPGPALPGEPPPAYQAPVRAEIPWGPVLGAGLVSAVVGFIIVRAVKTKRGKPK